MCSSVSDGRACLGVVPSFMEDEKWPSAFLVSEVAEKQISCFLYTNFSPFLLQEKQVLLYLLMLADEKWPFAFLIVEKQINVS